MKTVSVSEIISWKHCRRQWDFGFRRGLRRREVPPYFASGTAVHKTVGALVSREITAESLSSFARGQLEELVSPEDVEKFLPGVLRAVGNIPPWMLGTTWNVEKEITMSQGDIVVTGHPDLYTIYEDEIRLVEIKSQGLDTSVSPTEALLSYLLWNPQHRYYSVILEAMHHLPVYFHYVVLPTQPGKKSPDHIPWYFGNKELTRVSLEMWEAAREVGTLPITMNMSRSCEFCEYKDIDILYLTGGDIEGAIEEDYEEVKSHAGP